MIDLKSELAKHLQLKAQLLQAYPELTEDDPALLDSLEGATDLTSAIVLLIGSSEEDRILASALSLRIDEMEKRRDRLEARMEKKREFAARSMEEAGLRKLEAAEHTIVLTAGKPSVIITDETLLPPHVLIQPPPKADKRAIAGLLKSGVAVPGATLSNPMPHLTVRRS